MKRFHIHITVTDLARNIDFYTQLFGQAPSKQKPDYAKWMLDDPALNFAVSAKGEVSGINHLGFEVTEQQALAELKTQAKLASKDDVFEQGVVTCCHAKSEKHWTRDPQGIAWEHYMTMADAEHYGEDRAEDTNKCCIPLSSEHENQACCVPELSTSSCCN